MTDEKLVRDFIHACSAGHQGSIFSPPKCDVEEYKRLINQWKASKTDLVSVCIQHQNTDEDQ